MIIPQSILDVYSSIQASNHLPDITTMALNQETLNTLQTELAGWSQCVIVTQAQLNTAKTNVLKLQTQVDALSKLLSVE